MRFSVEGVSNEKSIFYQSYSIRQELRLQNGILEKLAKKKPPKKK